MLNTRPPKPSDSDVSGAFIGLLSRSIKTDLHSCTYINNEICSLTLREERRLRVFENMVMRRIRIFGPKRHKVTGN
jgi:hypothetical protein